MAFGCASRRRPRAVFVIPSSAIHWSSTLGADGATAPILSPAIGSDVLPYPGGAPWNLRGVLRGNAHRFGRPLCLRLILSGRGGRLQAGGGDLEGCGTVRGEAGLAADHGFRSNDGNCWVVTFLTEAVESNKQGDKNGVQRK